MLDELQQKYPMRGKGPKAGIPRTRGIKIVCDHVLLKHFQQILLQWFLCG